MRPLLFKSMTRLRQHRAGRTRYFRALFCDWLAKQKREEPNLNSPIKSHVRRHVTNDVGCFSQFQNDLVIIQCNTFTSFSDEILQRLTEDF